MNPTNSHVCQKCSAPLKLEATSSKENTSPNVKEEPRVAVEVAAVRKKNQKPAVPNFEENHYAEKAARLRNVGCQTPVPSMKKTASSGTGKFSQFFGTTIRLQEILDGDVELKNPLCVQCCDTLIETVDKRIKETEDEIRDEKDYLKNKKAEVDEESIEKLRAKLATLEAEERKQIKSYEDLKFERFITFKDRELQNRELKDLEKSLERDTQDYLRSKNEWYVLNDELTSLKNQDTYLNHRLKTLNETNAFEQMFKIQCNAPIGLINGFRLGSLTVCPVPWQEINFAWGHAIFLLDFLARMFEFDFKKYVLKPLGDRSRIEMPAKKSEKLPLHFFGQSERHLSSNFDAAQVAFIECLGQLEGEIKNRFQDFRLKHPILRHKIFERDSKIAYSVTYGFNSRDNWTKALKCVLEDLEQILKIFIDKVRTKQPQNSDQNE